MPLNILLPFLQGKSFMLFWLNNIKFYVLILLWCDKFWSRSKFTGQAICDTLVNNMSEAFNNTIINARSKAIITMMEDIRIYLMKRWAKNRVSIKKVEGSICPKIKNRLDNELDYKSVHSWSTKWDSNSAPNTSSSWTTTTNSGTTSTYKSETKIGF